MSSNTSINIGDNIYWYYPDRNYTGISCISNIIIKDTNNSETILMDNDNIICTKENIEKIIPDNQNIFYFLII